MLNWAQRNVQQEECIAQQEDAYHAKYPRGFEAENYREPPLDRE